MASLSTEVSGKTFGQLTTGTNPVKTNYLVVWDGSTNKKVAIEDVMKLGVEKSGYAHNGVYRGKYLGSSYTTEQMRQVAAGTFDDLYVGDYWTIGGVNYIIAGLDFDMSKGDSSIVSQHHLNMITGSCLYTHVMNDTNTTEGGYIGSKMYTEGLEQAKTKVKSAFGADHILSHRIYACNAVTNEAASSNIWVDSEVDLMNEIMVYGCPVRQAMSTAGTSVATYTADKTQLPYFRFKPHGFRDSFWLRDIASAATFCLSHLNGYATASNASNDLGVRPYFLLS